MLSNDSDFVVMGRLITFANFDLDGDLSAFMSAAPAGPPARLRARALPPPARHPHVLLPPVRGCIPGGPH